MTGLRRRCKNCGRPFVTTEEELDRCAKRNYPAPRMCLACRKIELIDRNQRKLIKYLHRVMQFLGMEVPPKKEEDAKQELPKKPRKRVVRKKTTRK